MEISESSEVCCIITFKAIGLPCQTGIVGDSDNLNLKSTPTGKVRAQRRTIYQFTSSTPLQDSILSRLSPSSHLTHLPVSLGTPIPA